MANDSQGREPDPVAPTPRHLRPRDLAAEKAEQAVPIGEAAETYRPKFWRLATWGICGGIGVLGLLGSVNPMEDPREVLGFALFTLAAWRFGYSRIVATPEVLTVVGLIVVRRIRWAEVTYVDADDAGVRIDLRGGKTCTAYAFFALSGEGAGNRTTSGALKAAARLRQLAVQYGTN